MGFAEIVAATGAGIGTTVVGHPLDTIKVHLQTNASLKNTLEASRAPIRERALFRGITPPLANAVLMNAVMFSVFARIKQEIGGDTFQSALLAGLVSGFATACISTPTDYIKIHAQVHGTSQMKLLFSTPFLHLFQGHAANLAREGVFTMVYLGFYDQLHPHGFWQIAAASSLTGGLAWVASYPFDTIKTVVQSSPTRMSYRQAMKRIGWDYFRGCGASTGRAIMVTSLRMIVYETMLQYISPTP